MNKLFGLIVAVIASLGPLAAPLQAATGPITQLSFGTPTNQQDAPAISGTHVTWTNAVSSPSGATSFDIFFLDLAGSGAAVNLTNVTTDQAFLQDIDGSQIVFVHTSPSIAGDIVLYDTSLGTSSVIAASNLTLHFEEPAVRGRYVAFLSASLSQTDVQLYDTTLGVTTAVTNDAALQGHPRLGNDMVVFEDYSSGYSQVYGYRISTNGPAVPLAAGSEAQTTPDIDGNTVVWIQSTATGDQVFAFDLTTNVVTQLTSSGSDKIQPRISGNRIVWSDDRSGNLDVYVYDLTTGIESALVAGAGDQFAPDIDGDRVVFVSNAAGFEQVYEIDFVSDFSISVSGGNLNLPQGAAGTSLVSTAVVSGGAGTIGLTVAGLPGGATASLNPTSVTAGGSSTLSVNAGTAAPGVYTLSVTGTEGPITHTANVTLTITGPQLRITPANIDFGTVKLFGLRLQSVTVTNVGTSAVSISNVSVTPGAGADVDDFTPLSFCGASLAPGKSCTIIVVFFADDVGTPTASLYITDNAASSPQAVSLTGTVIPR